MLFLQFLFFLILVPIGVLIINAKGGDDFSKFIISGRRKNVILSKYRYVIFISQIILWPLKI